MPRRLWELHERSPDVGVERILADDTSHRKSLNQISTQQSNPAKNSNAKSAAAMSSFDFRLNIRISFELPNFQADCGAV